MSPQNTPLLVLSFANHARIVSTWLHLNDRSFVQGTYIFHVERTFHFLKNGTSFINKIRDDLSIIDLIGGTKVIRITGWAVQVK